MRLMASRDVTVDGKLWTVWEVRPQSIGPRLIEAFANGWLAMHYGSEKRRIAPVPADWLEWSDEELADAVRGAKPAPPVRGASV